MPNLNKVMLMGHLTRDPELKYTPSNTPVTTIGLAVNRKWKNKDGSSGDETCFVDCEAWGRTAEVICQYVNKGDPLYVEGRLKLDQWEDQGGNKRSKLKVNIESFEFLKGKSDGDSGGSRSQAPAEAPVSVDDAEIPF